MKTNIHSPKKIVFLSLAILLSIALLVAILEKTNVTHLFHKEPPVLKVTSKTPTTGGASTSSQKGEVTSNGQLGSSSNNQPGDQKSNNGGDSTTVLINPSGDFVSNHHPNLSGTPAPNTISSVCTTTPGAQCTITFSKGGVIKSLPVQTTDREGSTYWNWKLQDIGLSQGTWEIKAIATLGAQTKSATDAISLEVQP
jgi:hypothetical protein